jgi:hypothetical protein
MDPTMKEAVKFSSCDLILILRDIIFFSEFLRRIAGYTLLDHKKNEDILQELNTTSVLEKITKYRHNWVKHVHRMNNSTFPKTLIEYHPRVRRRPGRPLKHLLDGVQTESETGHMGLIS